MKNDALFRPEDNMMAIRFFEEEKEEEKREIVSRLPSVFNLEISESSLDEGTRIYEPQNNIDDDDDDNDYYT